MLLLVAAWSLAEAILLVVVVDVPISWIAVRRGWRPALFASMVAAAAASAGGAVTFAWAAADPAGAAGAIAALPGIDPAMIERTASRFAKDGYTAMLVGSLTGIPYKLFALAAAEHGRSVLPFVLISAVARLPRFLLVAAAAAGLSRILAPRLGTRARLALLAGCWLLFYTCYFAVMPA
ncbi:MAG TPA: hypothetical protein VGW34_10090 [Allosphingosinicella sp.]|nr:hypothetical protein [Allosphingosinicella sp.]